MNKFFLIGLLILISALIICFILQDAYLLFQITGVAAVIPLIIAGLFTGAMGDGDQVRANFHAESKQARKERSTWMFNFVWLALPNVICVVVLVIVSIVHG
ncbi:DUF5316 domain-containing protein [Radiobacillus kanasensis]|uniref:DUF5316 domain-containing protein n=1 Tax=Radiobacillus kanasensis TaxID=2844358 RepID=UPI001E4CE45A|nr:DUF5316 domain-containing protein [Radiobacillus kanasensis]UFT99976.1 DUF5316 domain-containing protein [Radiobacillus kanasensis]